MNLKKLGLIIILCFCIALCSCKSKEAKNADALIEKIGTVTLDSEKAIKKAEKAVDKLTEEQIEELDNKKKLSDARVKYDRLVIEDGANQLNKLLREYQFKEITYNDTFRIANFRSQYDALDEETKALVTAYPILEQLEIKAEEARTLNRIESSLKIDFSIELFFNYGLDMVNTEFTYINYKRNYKDIITSASGTISFTDDRYGDKYTAKFSATIDYEEDENEYKVSWSSISDIRRQY